MSYGDQRTKSECLSIPLGIHAPADELGTLGNAEAEPVQLAPHAHGLADRHSYLAAIERVSAASF